MSKIALVGNATGSGTLSIEAPSTNTDRTFTLPDTDGTVVTTAGATFSGAVTLSGGISGNTTVDGGIVITSGLPQLTIQRNTTGASQFIAQNTNNNGAMIQFNNTGGIQFNERLSGVDRPVIATGGNGDVSFYEDTGITAKFFWDASAESLGIGTSSPSAKLHVEGSSAIIKLLESGGSEMRMAVTGSASYLGTYVNDPLVFTTNSTERMRIDSSGNLLVGTTNTNPAFNDTTGIALRADGLLSLSRTNNAIDINRDGTDGALINFRKDGTTVGTIGNSGTSTYLNGTGGLLYLINGTEKMKISAAGNVGIGTSSPDSLLTAEKDFGNVSGASAVALQIGNVSTVTSQTPGTRLLFNSGNRESGAIDVNHNTAGGDDASMNFVVRDGSNTMQERMRITSSGNVGIGTTTPGSKLTVEDPSSAELLLESTLSTNQQLKLSAIAFGTPEINVVNSNALIFKTNNTEAMRIDSSGRISVNDVQTTGYLNVTGDSNFSDTAYFRQNHSSNRCLFTQTTSTSYGDAMILQYAARSGASAYFFIRSFSSTGGDQEFYVRGDGQVGADGSFFGGGADYAEYFEWSDGNPDAEDRRGYSVVLDGDKIRKATDADSTSNILGVISVNASVVGDADMDRWKQKYQRDDFGTYILDEDGHRVLNPDYNEDQEYTSREDRPEWDTVGLMGKLRIRTGQPVGDRWIKMRDISETVEEWLVR